MLATIMNALAMRDVFEEFGINCRILSPISVRGVIDDYDRRKAMHHLSKNRLVIFAGGTGTTLVTTDAAASLRGIEINADILLKLPRLMVFIQKIHRKMQMRPYVSILIEKALKDELGIMDITAFSQCRDHNLPIKVFNIHQPGVL